MDNDEQFSLDDIENAYLEGLKLSSAQRARAIEAIDSVDMRMRIIACVALLCGKNATRKFRLKARKRFEGLCSELTERDDICKTEVLFSLLQIPMRELKVSRPMRELAYHAVNANRFTLRANAVLVLERFAAEGDSVAVSLIETALQDESDKVRANASVALRNVRR